MTKPQGTSAIGGGYCHGAQGYPEVGAALELFWVVLVVDWIYRAAARRLRCWDLYGLGTVTASHYFGTHFGGYVFVIKERPECL
jgi:hypothetical protein